MLTPLDTPTALDVLRGHQLLGEDATCSCGRVLPADEPRDRAVAVHQLGELQASGLAVVSVHGTAGVVEAAAAVVGVLRTRTQPQAYARLEAALRTLMERVEALGR